MKSRYEIKLPNLRHFKNDCVLNKKHCTLVRLSQTNSFWALNFTQRRAPLFLYCLIKAFPRAERKYNEDILIAGRYPTLENTVKEAALIDAPQRTENLIFFVCVFNIGHSKKDLFECEVSVLFGLLENLGWTVCLLTNFSLPEFVDSSFWIRLLEISDVWCSMSIKDTNKLAGLAWK